VRLTVVAFAILKNKQMKTFQVSKNLGRYNYCSNDKEWQVFVAIKHPSSPLKGIYELWDQDDEPDIDKSPQEVIEMIRDRLSTYLYSRRVEEYKPFFEWFESNRVEIDKLIDNERIEELNEKILDMQQEIIEIKEKYVE